MEEFGSVVQVYGTENVLKTGLNRPQLHQCLNKLYECDAQKSELSSQAEKKMKLCNWPVQGMRQSA